MHGTHSFKTCISPVPHPTPTGLDRLFVVSRPHTIRHTRTPGWTPLDEWSARHRGRYPHNTQRTQKTNFQALSAIRTRDPTSQADADLRLKTTRLSGSAKFMYAMWNFCDILWLVWHTQDNLPTGLVHCLVF